MGDLLVDLQRRQDRIVSIPFYRDKEFALRVDEALLQAVTHSHYHRAQNATRLRALGGEPPGTDLIVWYAKRRPAPRWP